MNIGYLLKHTESCVIRMNEVKQTGRLMYDAFLSSCQFRYALDSQSVGHIDEFLKVFRQSY